MAVIDAGKVETGTATPEHWAARAWSEFAESWIAVGALALVVLLIMWRSSRPGSRRRTPTTSLSSTSWTTCCRRASAASTASSIGSAPTSRAATWCRRSSTVRLSLFVGGVATVIALGVGTTVGIVAAYFGGKIDTILMRLVDIQLSFPAILIALILLAILGKGVDKVVIALVSVQWAYYARTIRGSALAERRREYIEAAQCLALPQSRIIFRHLLPNAFPPLVVVATVQVAHAIALEATLSFLGVGVPITEPSLGLLIANGYSYMLSGSYWIAFYPGIALLLAIAAINLVGDRLGEVLNPRLKR